MTILVRLHKKLSKSIINRYRGNKNTLSLIVYNMFNKPEIKNIKDNYISPVKLKEDHQE